ncbi:hypothetical protein ACEUZ9_004656 [Paracoccus litorisediminis]|uniref:hypothetical protein n=1 Tax=Paracoccus litorisediminis TaxID=2006130 RepID=UPI0037311AE7
MATRYGYGTEKAKAKGCTCFRKEFADQTVWVRDLKCPLHLHKSNNDGERQKDGGRG